ncbi:pentatricopeptide repeat-containing protein At2g29760, chloroplastic-like isoform X2 [Salvia splendens]|uniref:pentatricopeptide repeat-containing protein At2g29760, chloroplastic-like isoform X2 n=1 Tax=Salvia splendens TaxID=180675 RepID=UPI001C2742B2|nr:pentatricopeptide repeat-containing protein At2g29760, chloroplastic-like isoform X2 [Salvia splendens]
MQNVQPLTLEVCSLVMKLAAVCSRRFSTSNITKSNPFYGNRIVHERIRELHAHLVRTHHHRNSNAMSPVIKSYALSQISIHKAGSSFNDIDQPTLPIWNHMIRGHSAGDTPVAALHMFGKMHHSGLRGDNLTFIFLCKACARVLDFTFGEMVHVHIFKLGFESYLYVCNALIHMYGFCGELFYSRRVFDEMGDKDLVSWNSIICSYSQCANYYEVLGLFDAMVVENVKADAVTLVKVVLACNHLGAWKFLDYVVEYIENNRVHIDVYLGNTLINVYGRRGLIGFARRIFDRMTVRNVVSWNVMVIATAKSGDLAAARKIFSEMPERDVISWTSMITGYAQGNQHDDAISLLKEMMVAKAIPDKITVATVLSSCARLGRLEMGRAIHDYVINESVESDIYVENALIDMYCKCGSVEEAMEVFDEMKVKDSVSWSSVITGLAVNGNSGRALQLFMEMSRGGGLRPTHGAFVGVLLACVHSGLVEKGLEFFCSMQKDHGLAPEMTHYGCVVDLLCRSGDLSRAYEFIRKMPIVPSAAVWMILLSACKTHGNLVLARIASEKLLELDPGNGANYVLSSNSYASAERWDDAIKVRELMGSRDIPKPVGWSCVGTNHIPTEQSS